MLVRSMEKEAEAVQVCSCGRQQHHLCEGSGGGGGGCCGGGGDGDFL